MRAPASFFSLTVLLTAGAWVALVPQGQAQVVYNLAADWSTVSNPNGVWQLNKSPGQPFTTGQADWWSNSTGQFAWADQAFPLTAHVPFWMKLADGQVADLAAIGTVVMHTAETGRTGTEISSVVWTSPGAGTVVISGGAWLRTNFDRPQRWEVTHNGVSLTTGDLTLAGGFTQANPFAFAAGTGGTAAVNFNVQAGDTLGLLIYRLSSATPGHMVGLDLTVTFTAIPEPGTFTLMLTGLGWLVLRRRATPRAARRPG